ncbi:alpha/beta hydrolase [Flavobacterium orientale]|uniref:Alpha/beta hydrolase fold-3 domain-containing protein n=1 Tax=Flavobacterium orientale TaxID=1756020 RepID=A0A916XVK5_9FLAO|nr:alpha/beta hydrolase [Flavobacterium orientale]GGD14152.1 hypothetical protein GCM10011343_01520 [Flavobacterium orientale]
MAKSLSYYITLLVLKIKKVKYTFSQTPIPFEQLRENDVYFPKNSFFKGEHVTAFSLLKTKIVAIRNGGNPESLLLYLHGGAFVSGPTHYHWDAIEKIAKNTKHTVWMCNYPKAPEHKIDEISKNIDAVYKKALEEFKSDAITLMGDSVGGTLHIALTQRILSSNMGLPSKIVLISPVLDASLEHPDIALIDKIDPILSKKGVLSAKHMCAVNNHLKDARLSPLYGSFKGFPKTYLFIAENDITRPDQLLFAADLEKENIKKYIFYGKGMPHIWPLLPVMKESRKSLNEIIDFLNE